MITSMPMKSGMALSTSHSHPPVFHGNGFSIYTTGSGYTIQALPSPGHLRVTVNPTQATVDYVSSTNPSGTVNYSYTIDPYISGPTHVLTTAVSPSGGGTISPPAGTHTYAKIL